MNIYDFVVKDARGNSVKMSDYKGKVLLIVNTATDCGFTPQYEGLQDLYSKYEHRGFEIQHSAFSRKSRLTVQTPSPFSHS